MQEVVISELLKSSCALCCQVSGGDSDDECWSTVIEDKSKQDVMDVSLLSSTLSQVNLYLLYDIYFCHLVQGPFVAAGDIRRRLSESLSAPQALFKRDPEDPSGRT